MRWLTTGIRKRWSASERKSALAAINPGCSAHPTAPAGSDPPSRRPRRARGARPRSRSQPQIPRRCRLGRPCRRQRAAHPRFRPGSAAIRCSIAARTQLTSLVRSAVSNLWRCFGSSMAPRITLIPPAKDAHVAHCRDGSPDALHPRSGPPAPTAPVMNGPWCPPARSGFLAATCRADRARCARPAC